MAAALSLRRLLASRSLEIALLAVLYFLGARFGLSLGVVEQVSAVWPPSGLALAALFLFGTRLWPGVWLGALAANVLAEEPLWTALGVATGNTLEPVLGVWLLQRAGFESALERLRDVLALLLAAVCATLPAAVCGVASLCMGGVQPWDRFAELAGTWWLGDGMGVLLVATPLFAWSARGYVRWTPARVLEFLALVAGLAWASGTTFGEGPEGPPSPLRYAGYPFVIWAAIRFGQRGVGLAVLTICVISTRATVRGLGPFGIVDLEARWLPLQAFVGILAITGAMLGAAIGERDRAERHRSVEFAVARLLAQETDLALATRRIVRVICEKLDFDIGALLRVDPHAGALCCVELWHRPSLRAPEFVALTRATRFEPGRGLPGRVWSSGDPAWIEDALHDSNFVRASVAAKEGLHGAFGIPVVLEGEVLGVLEFLSRRVRRPDDELLHALSSIGTYVGHFLGRITAEDALRRSEARKAGVLASVMDAIVTIDHEGRLLEFNPGAERIFDLVAGDALGKEMATLIIPPRMREPHRRGLARAVETGRTSLLDRRLEMIAQRADGSEFPVELTITRVVGASPPQFTGYLRDITERKRAEEERAQLLERERVARAEAEGHASILREQQKAKDHFLAMLGHELRNPLAPVLNALHILRSESAASEAPKLYQLMERQVRHMARLVDDLLDVSRIARGTIDIRREPIDLAVVVARGVEASRALLEERRHRLVVDLTRESVLMQGDETRLHQVVSNLLNNAARYTPDGGEIAVLLERAGAEAVVRVRDSGIGIKEEQLQRIFDAFTQADRIPGRVHEGLGIGLTLTKQLVELHGGTIHARSAGPDRGSEFEVRLPLEVAEPAPCPAAASSKGVGVARRRVLVVDDNRDSADTLAALLRARGHETRVTYDGQEALACFGAQSADIVLLDIELPGDLDGYEVAARMRRMAANGRLRLVAVTGRAEDRARSLAAGFDLHVIKPLDPSDLDRIVAG